MPKTRQLPFEWYETPNIHLATLNDFVQLCQVDRIRIVDMLCIPGCPVCAGLLKVGLRNLGSDRVLVKIARE